MDPKAFLLIHAINTCSSREQAHGFLLGFQFVLMLAHYEPAFTAEVADSLRMDNHLSKAVAKDFRDAYTRALNATMETDR